MQIQKDYVQARIAKELQSTIYKQQSKLIHFTVCFLFLCYYLVNVLTFFFINLELNNQSYTATYIKYINYIDHWTKTVLLPISILKSEKI